MNTTNTSSAELRCLSKEVIRAMRHGVWPHMTGSRAQRKQRINALVRLASAPFFVDPVLEKTFVNGATFSFDEAMAGGCFTQLDCVGGFSLDLKTT